MQTTFDTIIRLAIQEMKEDGVWEGPMNQEIHWDEVKEYAETFDLDADKVAKDWIERAFDDALDAEQYREMI